MEIITGKVFELKNTCVTIGKFDGLHIGHQLLLEKLQKYRGLYTTVMISFEFTQLETTLYGKNDSIKLYSENEKIEYLKRKGPDVFIQYPFDHATADMSAYDFLKEILVGQLGVRVIVAGSNFRFGKGAEGDTDFLIRHEKEFGYITDVTECLESDGRIISSSRIRDEITRGNCADAELFLNRKYW